MLDPASVHDFGIKARMWAMSLPIQAILVGIIAWGSVLCLLGGRLFSVLAAALVLVTALALTAFQLVPLLPWMFVLAFAALFLNIRDRPESRRRRVRTEVSPGRPKQRF